MLKLKHLLPSLCLLSFSAPALAITQYIGINTNEAVHFDASLPFADVFRTAETFRENK